MIRRQVRFEGRAILPHFHDGEMVLARNILKQLETHHAFVLAAIGCEPFERRRSIRRVVGREVDMGHDVQLGILTVKQSACREKQKGCDGTSHGFC